MKKKTFYTEAAYVFGLIILAFSTALMEKADFGLSMVIAPAYILHLKVSQILPFFSFGMASYMVEGLLIIVMVLILRKFRLSYLFSFVTAVLYGLVLDLMIIIVSPIPADIIAVRVACYLFGMVFCALGVSLFFHTYISPEAYELFVKELSARFGININKFKTCYDCVSCLIGIILSFAFFGLWHFEGVKLGTVFCALINGWLIGRSSAIMEHFFEFKDGLKLKKYFQ